jgi:hypothetical protein
LNNGVLEIVIRLSNTVPVGRRLSELGRLEIIGLRNREPEASGSPFCTHKVTPKVTPRIQSLELLLASSTSTGFSRST